MTYNFCTLFNKKYLMYGLGLYHSLAQQKDDFHLYVVAFDDYTEDTLRKLSFPHLTVIALRDFEDDKLKAVKSTRTISEYCWTCSSSVILYCLKKFNLDACTYVDADLYFFDSPQPLIEELGDNSISLMEHRYSKGKEHDALLRGKYCVQFMTFKNNSQGLAALEWWREQNILWCYNRIEDGKFGDQKYLDDWESRFHGTYVLQNKGAIASWNINDYTFEKKGGSTIATDRESGECHPVVFYHFHNSKLFRYDNMVWVWGYIRDQQSFNILYKPYARALTTMLTKIRGLDPSFDSGFGPTKEFMILRFKRLLPGWFRDRIKSLIQNT